MSLFRRRTSSPKGDVSATGLGGTVFRSDTIVERSSGCPAAVVMPQPQHSKGFPLLNHNRNLGVPRNPTENISALKLEGPSGTTMTSCEARGEMYAGGFEEENMRTVLAMSPTEIEAALAEARQTFSAQSLQFLELRGGAPRAASGVCAPAQCINTTSRQTHGSTDKRDKLSWMDPEFDSSGGSIARPRIHAGNLERFDLEGRKIIHEDLFVEQFERSVLTDAMFQQIDKIAEVSTAMSDLLSSTARSFHRSAERHNLCRPMFDTMDAISDFSGGRELYHHEFEHRRAGYALQEACELMRSGVPAQNIIGMQILIGALKRREFLVSLEAYGACCFEVIDEDIEFDEMRTSSDLRLFSGEFDRLISCFSCGVANILSKIPTEAGRHWNKSMYNLETRMRRVVTFSVLNLVASDFPVELAYLVHRAIKSSTGTVSYKNVALQLLKSYAFSPFEEIAAKYINRTGSCSVSAFCCPSLMMPHTRRSELSYAEQTYNCLEKNACARKDVEAKDGAYLSVIDTWALQFRWFRLGGLFWNEEEGDLSKILFTNILQVCDAVKWLAAEVKVVSGTVDKLSLVLNLISDFKYQWAHVLDAADSSLEVVVAAARSVVFDLRHSACVNHQDISKNSLILNFSSVYKLVSSSLMENLLLVNLAELAVEFQGKNRDELLRILLLMGRIYCRWWHLVAELVAVIGLEASCLGELSLDGSNALLFRIFSFSVQYFHANVPDAQVVIDEIMLWGLQIWRSCLLSGNGINFVHDFLVCAKCCFTVEPTTLACNCHYQRPLLCLVSKILGLRRTFCFKNPDLLSASVVCSLLQMLGQAVRSCAAYYVSKFSSVEDDARLLYFDVLYSRNSLQSSPIPCEIEIIVDRLSRCLLQIGSQLLCVRSFPTLNQEGNAMQLNTEIDLFLASVFGACDTSRAESPVSLANSVASVCTIGIGLCTVILNLETVKLNLSDQTLEFTSLYDEIDCIFKKESVQSILCNLKSRASSIKECIYNFYAGLHRHVENNWDINRKCSMKSVQELSHALSLLRTFRSYLGIAKAQSVDVAWNDILALFQSLVPILLADSCDTMSAGLLHEPSSSVPAIMSDIEASGLFAWRSGLISQLILVETLGILAFCLKQDNKNGDKNLLAIFVRCIPLFSYELKPISLNLAAIFFSVVLQNCKYGKEMDTVALSIVMIQGLPSSLHEDYLTILSNRHMQEALLTSGRLLAGYLLRRSESYTLCFKRMTAFSTTKVASDKNRPPWLYDICVKLEGVDFFNWLATVADILTLHELSWDGQDENSTSSFIPDGSSARNIGSILFSLLEMTLPNNTYRWSDKNKETEDDLNLAIGHFVGVLQLKLVQLRNNRISSALYYSQFVQRVHSKFLILPRANSTADDACLSSLVEFNSQLIEATFAALIDHKVHSSSLAILLMPCLNMPAHIHQTIWMRFGEERLLHLLAESPLFKQCAMCFIPAVVTDMDFNVIKAMCYSIGRIRSQSDLQTPLCRLCIIRVAQFLFVEDVVSAKRGSMLRDIFASFSPDTQCWYSNTFVDLLLSAAVNLPTIALITKNCEKDRSCAISEMNQLSAQLLLVGGIADREKICNFVNEKMVDESSKRDDDKGIKKIVSVSELMMDSRRYFIHIP